jgi:hypothetical protein
MKWIFCVTRLAKTLALVPLSANFFCSYLWCWEGAVTAVEEAPKVQEGGGGMVTSMAKKWAESGD